MKTKNLAASSDPTKGTIVNFAATWILAHAAALCLLVATPLSVQAARQAPRTRGPIDISPPAPVVPSDSPSSQSAAPADVSPDHNTDVSTTITTGGGYDAYTGAVRRRVIDLVVPGSIGSEPLRVVRTYSSMPYGVWSFDFGGSEASISARPEYSTYVVSFGDGRRINFKPPKASQTGETAWRGPLGTKERLFINNIDQYRGTVDLWMEDGSHKLFERRSELSSNDQYVIDIFTPLYFEDPYGQRTTFTHEQIPGTYDPEDVRIKEIRDASGRSLTFTYNGRFVSQITASNGQWVRYNGSSPTRVDYSDGTFATYTHETIPVIHFDGTPGTEPRLITAQDTRAEGPMRAIQYEYTASPQKDFPGEIKAERHLGDGVLVSAFARTNGRTINTDTRGDGPSRTFNLEKVDNIPLITSKSDFKGQFEYYFYDANNYLRKVTDRRGHSTTYINEPILGRPKRITHPGGTSYREYEYTDNLNPYHVASIRDERDNTTVYHRDGQNRVYQIDHPNGAVETFAYNGFGQVVTHKRTNGVYDAYDHCAYDSTGRLTKRWNPTPSADYPPSDALPHTLYSYYTSADVWQWEDRIRSVVDPLGRVTLYEYDRGSDGLPRAGRGLVTKISYPHDTHNGALPYGTSQSFGYDIYGNRTSVSDELGHTTLYEYDDYNRVIKVTNPLNQFTTTSYALDWVNPYLHTTKSVKYVVSPMNKNVVFDYDPNLRKRDQVSALNTPDEAWTLYDYDPVGNLITTTDPRGKVTTYGYDERNRQISVKNNELNETTVWEYDGVGNKTKERRQDTTFRTWDYDTMNRLWHVYDWRMSDPPAADDTTTYGRDLAGNVRTITDAKGAVYRYDYDLNNLKISETYPVDATNVSRTYACHYDDAGNLDYFKNPAGQYKHIDFDARNRPRHSWWDGGVGPDVVTNYDAAGRMTDISTNGGETVVAFGYDDVNRKLWEDQTVAGYPTRHVQTDRDLDGNRTSLEVTGWYALRYDYTGRNQLSHIYGGNWEPWFNYTYDAAGNMTRRQDVYAGVNDSTKAEYDALNRPSMWEQTGTGDVFFARSWQQYDKVNRLTATWRDEQASKGELFGYNARNQLTSASYNADQVWTGIPLNSLRDVSYDLDPLNRRSVTDSIEGVTNYTPNALNQYESIDGTVNNYDGNFNLTGLGGLGASYDAANRLVFVSSAEDCAQFVYDGLGRCLKRTINWETTLIAYDGWKPIVEWNVWDGQAYFKAWNIYGPGADEILWRYAEQYGHLRYHLDRMGNVAFLLDLDGIVREKYTYDAFGRPIVSDWDGGNARSWSWYGNRFMFTGREWIPEFGLYDYRNRFYHPLLGRFLQADPNGFDDGDMNPFRYVGDDPLGKVDPMGLAAVPHMRHYSDPLFLANYYANTKEYEAAAQAMVSAFNRSQTEWKAHFEMTHPPSSEFKRGQVATTQWEAKSTVTSENGNIVKTSANLNITTRWNDAAPAAAQQAALRKGSGEIAHVGDALKYVNKAGSFLDRSSWSGWVARKVPAGAVSFGVTSHQIIGTNMSTGDAERQLDKTLNDWVKGSMAVSHDYWDNSGKHAYGLFSTP